MLTPNDKMSFTVQFETLGDRAKFYGLLYENKVACDSLAQGQDFETGKYTFSATIDAESIGIEDLDDCIRQSNGVTLLCG